METVERFEEDTFDLARIHRPWHVILAFGEAIEVSPDKVRGAVDPLLPLLAERLHALLASLQTEAGPPLPLPESLAALGL